MLLGRGIECARLDSLLEGARAGRSAALVVRGEAGIGKTAILRYVLHRADDFRRLTASGYESESELAFAGLADVFRPVLGLIDRIPGPQADALAGALAIGEPVRSDRFAACAGTLSLLAQAAEDSPLLVAVDDAQWLDPSSAEALLFTARRLDAEGAIVLFGVREGESSRFERTGLPELALGGLDREAVGALLAAQAGIPVADDVADRLHADTGGNPLAVIEIAQLLSEDELAGRNPLPADLRIAPTLARALLRPVGELAPPTQRALVIAAASGSGDAEAVRRAVVATGLDSHALDPAVRAGVVVEKDGRFEFRHPLLRSAVYTSADDGERQRAHRALAAAAEEAHLGSRRAWHLAAASHDHDDDAAAALEQAALDARLRGGHAEAARALERAARLTADDAERSRRLRDSAVDGLLAGRIDDARTLLEDALPGATDERARARIQHVRGVVEMWDGRPRRARALLGEAERVEVVDRDRAARMWTDAVWACFMASDLAAGLETAERARSLGAGLGGGTERNATAVLGLALVLRGEAKRAIPLLLDYHRSLRDEPKAPALNQLARPAGQVLMWFEEYDEARQTLTRAIDSARACSALGALPYALGVLAEIEYRTGRWMSSYAAAAEAVRIAEETDQQSTLAYGLACLAQLEAAQGRGEECRPHVERALRLAGSELGAIVAYASAATGLLELGLGRNDEAIVVLEQLASLVREHGLGEPAVIQWAPDLVEALVRAGRGDDAERALAEFEDRARTTERVWALATAARCRGLLAAEDVFETAFTEALELHGRTPTPFERARTELCLGERLRRARRRADARAPLRSALETLEQLGARPWADRARGELAATGETLRRRDPAAADQLTPTEVQVALLVARGATNRETGAALFLSPKTIETHLGRIYRKLGLRSRTELARLLATEGTLAETA